MSAAVLSLSTKKIAAAAAAAEALRERGFALERGAAGEIVVVAAGEDLPPRRLTINPVRAAMLAASPEDSALLLHVHGIPILPERLPKGVVRPASQPDPAALTPLRVHVGDLRVLAVESDTSLPQLSRLREQRMMEAACRSVYSLGLHFGCVHLYASRSGRFYIDRVDPYPAVGPDLARAYASSIAQLVTAWSAPSTQPEDEVVLGADPEFALFSRDGRILYASTYVKHRGTVGYDRQSRANRGSVFPLVEVRPNPSPSPFALFAGTEKALAAARRVLPHRGVLWTAGSCPFNRYPTGGHIHFSGLTLSTPLLAALDNYLAIPTMLLEQRSRARRRRQKYGRLGDFRRKEHGGFEYRTVASWLVSPQATLAALCLAKVVATHWRRLPASAIAEARVALDFYRGRKARFRQIFPQLWRTLMQTETAASYAYELNYIARSIERGAEWQDESDFKQNWW